MQGRTITIVVSAISITALTLSSAHSAPSEPVDDPAPLAVQAYARDHGVDLLSAELAVTDQQALISSINVTDTELGAEADVWVSRDHERQVFNVRTTDTSIATAIASLDLTESTFVEVIDEPPVASQVPALTADVEAIVRHHAPGVQGMYIRTEDGSLVVETTDAPSAVDHAMLAVETGFQAVAVEQVDEASDSILTRGGVGMSSCTAAFSARNGSSYIGVFSAAHCGTSQRVYTNTAGTGSYATGTRTLKVHNANADIGFYSIPSGNYVSSSFFGDSSTSATSVGAPQDVPEGITVCHRGKTSGRKCGTITSIAYRPTWSGACPNTTCNAVFVRVSAQQAPGDSGGPWWNGNHPIGIHKGGASNWSVYSKISRIPSGTSLY